MFTLTAPQNPFSYAFKEIKNSILYRFYSKKWEAQYCTICCKKMPPSYMLVFNVHLAAEHTAQVQFHCPNNCKKIHAWAHKEDLSIEMYSYNVGEYGLTYYCFGGKKPKYIRMYIGSSVSEIPFFDLERMTKNGIIKRVSRLVPFI